MIAIIKYNAGNITSVENAVNRAGYECTVTDDPAEIRTADKIIFPGVGEAGSAMKYLKEKKIDTLLISLTQPVLGICLGLQLMCTRSEEADTNCLGIFNAQVKKFPPDEIVPHMGWNNTGDLQGPLFKGLSNKDDFYFVHGYYAEPCSETIATCNYILPFSAAMQKNNFYGVQFHPEKSAGAGAILLKNFLNM